MGDDREEKTLNTTGVSKRKRDEGGGDQDVPQSNKSKKKIVKQGGGPTSTPTTLAREKGALKEKTSVRRIQNLKRENCFSGM